MILRRIGSAIKRQDWFVVFIELMIVVVGIYIGLQVDDWQKERENRALEKEYLERLYDDVQGSIDDQLATEGWDKARIRTQALVIKDLLVGELPEKDIEDFEFGLATFGIMNPLALRWATVEELKATGNLGIIRDVELRQMLGNFEGEFARWNNLIDFSNQTTIRERTFITGKFALSTWKGEEDETRHKVIYDFEALAGDKAFIARLSHIQDGTLFIRLAQKRHIEGLKRLKSKIAGNLGIEEQEEEPR